MNLSMDEVVDGYLHQLGLKRPSISEDENIISSKSSTAYQFLCNLIQKHTQTFPFCTVNHMLHYFYQNNKNDVFEPEGYKTTLHQVSTRDLYQRICVDRTGGYCFEHNKLVYDILQHLGYPNIQLVLARVVNNNLNERPPLTHRLTLVQLGVNNYYIVDCAFGGEKGPLLPIPVPSKNGKDTSNEEVVVDNLGRSFRILYDPTKQDPYHMQCCFDSLTNPEYFTTYIFTLFDYTHGEQDAIAGHFYSHNFPTAIFTTNVLVGSTHTNSIPNKNEPQEIRVLWNLSYRRYLFANNNANISSNNNNNVNNKRIISSTHNDTTVESSSHLYSIMINDFGLAGITEKYCQRIFTILRSRNNETVN